MQQLDSGFPIGEQRFGWGSMIADVQARLPMADIYKPASNATRLVAKCSSAFQFLTLSAELSAPRPDRPITELCYQLAPVAGADHPSSDHLAISLRNLLGKPREASEYPLPDDGDLSGSVRYYATWDAGDCSVGLSLYGAPRETEFGKAPGCLWISWSIVAAAQPYIAKWREAADELARCTPSQIAGFGLGAPQQPVFWATGRIAPAAASQGDASYALMHPELLPTPKAISALVGRNGFAFWLCEETGHWCASNAWDTILLSGEALNEISWNDIQPAKGGGFSELTIGRWCARDYANSKAVRDSVQALKNIPGVRVNHNTGYDV